MHDSICWRKKCAQFWISLACLFSHFSLAAFFTFLPHTYPAIWKSNFESFFAVVYKCCIILSDFTTCIFVEISSLFCTFLTCCESCIFQLILLESQVTLVAFTTLWSSQDSSFKAHKTTSRWPANCPIPSSARFGPKYQSAHRQVFVVFPEGLWCFWKDLAPPLIEVFPLPEALFLEPQTLWAPLS